MNLGNKNSEKDFKEVQEDFLYSIKFLHGEALRLGMVDVALILEEAIYQGAKIVDENEHPIQFLKQKVPEVYFTREFRKLDPEQKKLLLMFLEKTEK